MERSPAAGTDAPGAADAARATWLVAPQLGHVLQAIVAGGTRPGQAERVCDVLEQLPGLRLEALRLPGGHWDHPRDASEIAALEPLLTSATATLVQGGVDAPRVTVAIGARPWAAAYAFGSGEPPGVLVVSAEGVPDAVGDALLRVLVEALDWAVTPAAPAPGSTPEPERLHTRGAGLDIERELAAVVVDERGLQGIADAVHRLLGVPCAVWDERGHPSAAAGIEDEVHALRDERRRLRGTDVRVVRDSTHDWIVAEVVHDGELVAAVGTPPRADAEEDVDDDRAAAVLVPAAVAAAAEFLRRRSVTAAEVQVWGELAAEVLFESDRELVRRHAASVRYDVDAPHRVLVVACTKQAERMLPAIRSAARYLDVGTAVLVDDTRIAVLCRRDGAWDEIVRSAEPTSGEPCCAGLSSEASGLDAPTLFAEADLACAVGRAVGGPVVTKFDDLGLLRLLAAAGKPEQIVDFVESNVGVLIEYDDVHHAALVQTLCTYLDSGASLRVAAERLVIHESTLKYRLNRIQSLTGHDLSDPETRFTLHLACRAWDAARILREMGSDSPG